MSVTNKNVSKVIGIGGRTALAIKIHTGVKQIKGEKNQSWIKLVGRKETVDNANDVIK